MEKVDIKKLYELMYEHMGPQGWWPAETKPEIIFGAILVQNTNWNNVTKSLYNLNTKTEFDTNVIVNLKKKELELLIKPSGFYINKSQTIINIFDFFEKYNWDYNLIQCKYGNNLRERLLDINGIGSETADVLLLYVFDQTVFVSDKYARTLFRFLLNIEYKNYQQMANGVQLTNKFDLNMAQEFHGLIDEFGKQYLHNVETFKTSFLYKRRNEICYI